jgi:hypothetical protein
VTDHRKTSILHHEFSMSSFEKYDEHALKILAALQTGEDRQLELLVRSSESRQRLDDKLAGIDGTIQDNADRLASSFDDLARKVLDMAKPSLKQAFIDSLYFPEFRERERNVSEPCKSTFEWFFKHELDESMMYPGPPNHASWRSFPRWLEDSDSNQQYWLSGKAGSGKSTLMAQIIRNLERTKDHLRHWSGSRHLCTLSFFLFRAGSRLQVGFKYLLRSLLYQLVIGIPALQEILMARFLLIGSDSRVATWPTSTLKDMLSFAINTADDCHFFILIDGIDEFQSHEQMGEDDFTAAELVEFIYEVQKPSHVKLCVLSRPELRIAERHPSFLETKLAMLNRLDIWTFVHKKLAALPGLDQGDLVAKAICDRAHRMFMWAVFALREMKDGYAFEEAFTELLERLDNMGPSLATSISHMLRSVEVQHKRQVAFYIQAIGSWEAAGKTGPKPWFHAPMTVATITAARSDCQSLSTSEFVARCEEEKRGLRNFTRGLLEVVCPEWQGKESILIQPFHDRSNDATSQHKTPTDWPDTHLCHVVSTNGHTLRLAMYWHSDVQLVHRSAYDFFFSETDEVDRQAPRALMRYNNAAEVPIKVQNSLYYLFWIVPLSMWLGRDSKSIRREVWLEYLEEQLDQVVWYTARASISQRCRIEFLDRFLSQLRLETLPLQARRPSRERLEHVPGDIFCN